MSNSAEKAKVLPKAFGWYKRNDGHYEVVSIEYDAENNEARIIERKDVGIQKAKAMLQFERYVFGGRLMAK